jgi:hypothetical protein
LEEAAQECGFYFGNYASDNDEPIRDVYGKRPRNRVNNLIALHFMKTLAITETSALVAGMQEVIKLHL